MDADHVYNKLLIPSDSKLALVVLDVDPWITGPRCLEEYVAGACLAGLPEILLANFLKVAEPHVGRFAPHLLEDLRGGHHPSMVSIVAPLFNPPIPRAHRCGGPNIPG